MSEDHIADLVAEPYSGHQACSVLARAVYVSLGDLTTSIGGNEAMAYATVAVFLHQLAHIPKDRQKMVSALRIVADELESLAAEEAARNV
jgi:hypothetical protein